MLQLIFLVNTFLFLFNNIRHSLIFYNLHRFLAGNNFTTIERCMAILYAELRTTLPLKHLYGWYVYRWRESTANILQDEYDRETGSETGGRGSEDLLSQVKEYSLKKYHRHPHHHHYHHRYHHQCQQHHPHISGSSMGGERWIPESCRVLSQDWRTGNQVWLTRAIMFICCCCSLLTGDQ